MVPSEGIEPSQPCGYTVLSRARLPNPPTGQVAGHDLDDPPALRRHRPQNSIFYPNILGDFKEINGVHSVLVK